MLVCRCVLVAAQVHTSAAAHTTAVLLRVTVQFLSVPAAAVPVLNVNGLFFDFAVRAPSLQRPTLPCAVTSVLTTVWPKTMYYPIARAQVPSRRCRRIPGLAHRHCRRCLYWV